jgi:hypothetical protein
MPTTTKSLDELRAEAQAAAQALAEAEATHTREQEAERMATVADALLEMGKTVKAAQTAAGNGDTPAARQAISDLIGLARTVQGVIGQARKPRSANGGNGNGDRAAPQPLKPIVLDHLKAHPCDSFTPSALAKVLDRSPGAVSVALKSLTKDGVAVQASTKPQAWKLA